MSRKYLNFGNLPWDLLTGGCRRRRGQRLHGVDCDVAIAPVLHSEAAGPTPVDVADVIIWVLHCVGAHGVVGGS